jgi:membrane protein
MLRQTVEEISARDHSGIRFALDCAGALWAALNSTWAMVWGLNRAYEVEERRSWWELGLTITGLTFSMAVTSILARWLILETASLTDGPVLPRVLDWVVLTAALSLTFALLYRFAPNLHDHEWRWSTPGAVCALILWMGATLVAQFYFGRVNDYSRTYGHLNGVAVFLLWLYVTNGAILIGGEMNSEIEKSACGRGAAQHEAQRSLHRSG